MREGTVIWYNDDKGYGIIESDEERFLVHESDIVDLPKRKKLAKEKRVKFREESRSSKAPTPNGLKRAKDVEVF